MAASGRPRRAADRAALRVVADGRGQKEHHTTAHDQRQPLELVGAAFAQGPEGKERRGDEVHREDDEFHGPGDVLELTDMDRYEQAQGAQHHAAHHQGRHQVEPAAPRNGGVEPRNEEGQAEAYE